MSGILSPRNVVPVIFLALVASVRPAHAGSPHDYDQSGTVTAMTRGLGYIYRVESSSMMYSMLCARTHFIQARPQPCNWNGRPIAKGDAVRFRIDGDAAFMPAGAGREQVLTVQMSESKVLPPLSPAPPGLEAAVVLGLGFAPSGASRTFTPFSAGPAPSFPTSSGSGVASGSMAPVLAIPTTGGPPQVVIPTSPSGPVVTGIPVTGGAPITAIPVSPTPIATSSDGPVFPPEDEPPSAPITVAPLWIHSLRLQTASHVYDLACAGLNCTLDGTLIHTCDPLALRVENKSVYISSASHPRAQRFRILAVRNLEDPSPNQP